MSYDCKILADSISAGHRLTTFEVTFPRFVLAEFNTHRALSKNSASSRAIPVKKSIAAVKADPFIPEQFVKNQPGMSADDALNNNEADFARALWRGGIDAAVEYASWLERLEVHKALANRVLEPYKWHTAITTATDWSNFFALRTAANAQPEIRTIALMMQDQYRHGSPREIGPGDLWPVHTPLVDKAEVVSVGGSWEETIAYWCKVSVGRCARVSYLTHHGERDLEADIALHDKLLESRHLSPFEHVAQPFTQLEWEDIRTLQNFAKRIGGDMPHILNIKRKMEYAGNLRGWWSARMDISHEHDYALV